MRRSFRTLRRERAGRRISWDLRKPDAGCWFSRVRNALWLIIMAALLNGPQMSRAAEPSRTEPPKVAWYQNFRQAAREAERLQKPLLVEITASWCGYCRKMEQETLSDAEVVRHIQRCFVPVTVDADREKQLVKLIGIEGLPTTVIISPELKVVRRITGFQNAPEFNSHLRDVCPAHQERTVVGASLRPDVSASASPTRQRGKSDGSAAAGTVELSSSDPAESAATANAAPAFNGLCLVSLLDERKLVRGSDRHKLTFRQKTVHFASAEFKERFRNDPRRYWPALDGHCVVSAVDEESLELGEPEWAAVFQEQVWFFGSAKHRDRFATQPENYVSIEPRR